MRCVGLLLSCLVVAACGRVTTTSLADVAPTSLGLPQSPTTSSPPSTSPIVSPRTTPSARTTQAATPFVPARPTNSPPSGAGYDQVRGLDPSDVTVVPQSEGLNPAYPAFCGRNAVFVGADPAGIDLLDFATGAVRRVAGPVGGFGVSDPTLSENWIVWISPRHESKADRGPLRWVISALPVTDVDANPVEVASGTSVEPPFPNEPLLAIDGDLLAYTVESPQPGHPQATAIVVHNLATGTDVTRIQTEESLWSLDLSGANVIYSE